MKQRWLWGMDVQREGTDEEVAEVGQWRSCRGVP